MEFETTAEAFLKARERASVAAAMEAEILHTAVHDARMSGMSVRQASAALGVPKSTVSRHWRDGHRCPEVLPHWGSEAAWKEAHAAIWSHDVKQLANDQPPYEWQQRDAISQTAARRPALSDPAQTPTACAGGTCGHCPGCRTAAPGQA